jgi:hypothetical protein
MLNILVETKNEYISHLINILTPLIFEGMQSIYKEAHKTSDANDVLKIFQTYLKRIPKWNQNLINKETERIINSSHSYGWLGDLIKATLKSSLIVLMYNPTKKIQERVDSSFYKNISVSDFIHKVYIECAREIWNNPYLLYHNYPPIEIKRNQRDCMNIIKDCIREALRKLLPVKHILSIYLGEDIEEDIQNNNFEKSISEADEKNLTKIIKKDLSNKELEYKIFEENIPIEDSKTDSRTIGSKILNIIKPIDSKTSITSSLVKTNKNDIDETSILLNNLVKKNNVGQSKNNINQDDISSDNSYISDKDIPSGSSITGSLDNATSDLDSDIEKSIKDKDNLIENNLDNKIKKILNNDLIETEFDTSLTEMNGAKFQEIFSNSDKIKKDVKTDKLFKKFMDF